MGLVLPNPIGLAAGFDKDARRSAACAGSASAPSRSAPSRRGRSPATPAPRVFRLEQDRAVINRYGMNGPASTHRSPGSRASRRGRVPVGANVGINKEGADPERDYPRLVAAVAPMWTTS